LSATTLETCNADPCLVKLEANGVGFTAHIIGFGLKEEEFKSLNA
jgi:Ca-activated chloride channel family protein